MKVCLYLEGGDVLSQCGIGTALKRQETALKSAGVDYTTDPTDDYDILHTNTIGPKTLYYVSRAHKAGKKVVMHAHTLDVDTRNSFTGSNTIMPIFKEYLKFIYGKADLLLCPSPYAKGILREYGMKQRIVPISNGVDLNTFKFSETRRKKYRKEFGLEGVVPFSVGHVFARKGVKTFVDVAERMDNQFIWFGKIYNKFLVSSREIEEMVNNPPKNVHFTGFVDDIIAAYCAGDILFFPSLAETQGIVVLEAMAMGRPVVVRKLPVYDGWLHDGRDCLMCSNDDEFIDTIKRLEDDKTEVQRLVKNANETIKGHSLDLIGKQLREVYESLK